MSSWGADQENFEYRDTTEEYDDERDGLDKEAKNKNIFVFVSDYWTIHIVCMYVCFIWIPAWI